MMGVVFCGVGYPHPGAGFRKAQSAPAIIFYYLYKRPRVEDSNSIFLGLGEQKGNAIKGLLPH